MRWKMRYSIGAWKFGRPFPRFPSQNDAPTHAHLAASTAN